MRNEVSSIQCSIPNTDGVSLWLQWYTVVGSLWALFLLFDDVCLAGFRLRGLRPRVWTRSSGVSGQAPSARRVSGNHGVWLNICICIQTSEYIYIYMSMFMLAFRELRVGCGSRFISKGYHATSRRELARCSGHLLEGNWTIDHSTHQQKLAYAESLRKDHGDPDHLVSMIENGSFHSLV